MSIPAMAETIDALQKLNDLEKNALPDVTIYTDGACSGNPGPGGWGAVVCYLNLESDLKGGTHQTTNNRMEMMAAIQGLKAVPLKAKVTIYTDSMYLRDGITRWMINWKKNGWKTADKKPVKNQDLWLELDQLLTTQEITWQWVKGHAGHEYNERADALARQGVIAQRMKML
jgi:ribonuclease HI